MKNIAIFTDNLKVGGIQKSVVNLLNNLDYSKFKIDLYIFDDDCFYEIPKEANVIKLKKPHKIFHFLPFKLVYKILKPQVLDKKYNLAIDFDSYQMHTAIGALKCNALKKAIWVHNDIPIKLKEEPKYRILHFFFKKKYRMFDIFCGVSKGAIDSFKEIENYDDKKYYVIPNYIDVVEIKEKVKEKGIDVKKDLINIITVGRLCHQKAIDIMLDQIYELKKYRQDFHLYIVGDGPDYDKLIEQQKALKLEKEVTFLGNQKNPFKYLKEMDLFYLASRYEGQGMVILEAMAVGLDVLIPMHLEKYCPMAKGTENIIEYLKNYKKTKRKGFNDLKEYNNDILKRIEKLFLLEEVAND